MPIQLLPQREPFARDVGRAEIIRGASYWRLMAALEKYCRGRTSGRSFVVSGNRGAGKTTMVLAAVEDLIGEAAAENWERRLTATRGDRPVLCRPLLVKLSGPDIVRERMRAPIENVPSSANDTNGKNGQATDPYPPDSPENLLRHLARGLHIALAGEFSRRFEHVLPRRARGADSELLEAWAQLTLELNEGAKVQTLRRFWELARSLQRGVLFESPAAPDRQGLHELVALDVSADAYRIAIGDVKRRVKLARSEKAGGAEVQWADELRKLAAPITGVVGGAATGIGVFQLSGATGIWSMIGAVAVALLSMMVLTATLAPKRTRDDTETLDFSPDTSVGSLAWRLGRSIDLLFRAGLAPVFVIDELDKSPDNKHLGDWISERAQELKSLLTERAFFCFLTGREYAEKMHRDRLLKTYPPGYTQFSDYLFVNYLPVELHAHLRRLMKRTPPKTSDAAAAQQEEDRLEAVMPFLVLFRAEMHPIDVRRQLNTLIRADDVVTAEAGQLRNIDRIQLLYQLAAEYALSRDNIEPRMRDDPRFALLALDAVYYAARQWPASAELDISEQAVSKYLDERRMPDTKGCPTELTRGERRLLQSCVFMVVELLQSPGRMHALLEEDWFKQRLHDGSGAAQDDVVQQRAALVADALPSEAALGLGAADAATLFHWRFDIHGLPLVPKDQHELARQALAEFGALRHELHEPLQRTCGEGIDWLERSSVIRGPIHWSTALEMRARLERGILSLEYPDMLTDALTLREYVGIVVRALPALCQLVVMARVLAAADARLHEAVYLVSSALKLDRVSNDETNRRIGSVWTGLAGSVDGASSLEMPTDLKELGARLETLLDRAASLGKPSESSIDEAYWALWRQRLLERSRGGSAAPPSWPDIVWYLRRKGESTLLEGAVSGGYVGTWSKIAISAITNRPASDRVTYPGAIAMFALRELGALQIASLLPDSDPTLLAVMRSQKDNLERRLVVIITFNGSASRIRQWLPSSEHAGIMIEHSHVEAVVRGLKRALQDHDARSTLRNSWLIVEAGDSEGRRAPEELLDGIVSRHQIELWPVERRVQLFAREPPPSPARDVIAKVFGSPPRVIFGARSIDDAVRMADELDQPEPVPRLEVPA